MKRCVLQPLSPREIQARARAGASPEVIAAETGWPLDKVTRYAEPLLGERAYVAEQAAAVEVSRSRGGATLHQSVCVRLDVDPDTEAVSWDSYRNPEGRWIVTAFHDGAPVGTWIFEEVGRSVHPQDEAARALMGGGPTAVADQADEPVGARGSAEPVPANPVPANPVPADRMPDDSDAAPVDPSAPNEPSTEPSAELTTDEPPRPRLVSVTSDPLAGSDSATRADGESAGPEPSSPAAIPESAPAALFDDTDVASTTGTPKKTKRSKGKRGRASVPSWDEILFGATKNED